MKGFKRTIECGLVSEQLVGKPVVVNGWVHNRRDHGGVIFIDLRDRSGLVQFVFNPEVNTSIMDLAHTLRGEYVIAAKGVLVYRDAFLINPKMATGKYEIKVEAFELFAKSEPMPFQLDEADHVSEELRLKYRYLDLRRPKMQHFFTFRDAFFFFFC